MLERDPYDEHANTPIISSLRDAGRHREARRRHTVYVASMHDVGVEPLPFPVPATPLRTRSTVDIVP